MLEAPKMLPVKESDEKIWNKILMSCAGFPLSKKALNLICLNKAFLKGDTVT